MVTPLRTPASDRSVGVSLSPSELVAHLGGGMVHRWPLAPLTSDTHEWTALTAALRALATMNGVAGPLDVALMPAFAELRTVDLPPMRDDEARVLLTRNAGRYFLGARGPQVVGVARGGNGAPSVVAAAAPRHVLTALHAAAEQTDWHVRRVTPAESAWAAAADAMAPAAQRLGARVLVCLEDRHILLQLAKGRIISVRRFLGGAADAALLADALRVHATSRPLTVLLGARTHSAALRAALHDDARALWQPMGSDSERAEDLALLAAMSVGMAVAPALESDESMALRRGDERRIVARALGGAAALLVVAAAVTLWGAHHQLASVRAERAALRPRLSTTLVGRTTVETANRQLRTLLDAERTAPQWASLIGDVAQRLDDGAYLTTWRGRGDSLVVEGVADRAAKAYETLLAVPGLANVRAAAPVRRESPNGDDAMERFTVAATLVGVRATAPTSSTVGTATRGTP